MTASTPHRSSAARGWALALLAAVALWAPACGDDDDPQPAPRPATEAPAPAAPAPVPPARREAARQASPAFGVNASPLFNDSALDPARLEAHLSHMRRTGVTLVRTDALWMSSEPLPPEAGRRRYDWRFCDRIAGALARHGIRWWPILDYAPEWAGTVRKDLHAPPRDPADFGAFAGAFARRYGPEGAFWREHPELVAHPVEVYEIWNEPNVGVFWPPKPDVGRYSGAYAAAEAALERADPRGRVLVGGLVPTPAWVGQMLARRPGLRGRIDGVAVHPYSPEPAGVLLHMRAMRAGLDAAGLPDVPLEVTEVGWQTRPRSARWFATAERRAANLLAAWRALDRAGLRVDAYMPFAWTTSERRPENEDDWYGLVSPHAAGTDTVGTRALARLLEGGR